MSNHARPSTMHINSHQTPGAPHNATASHNASTASAHTPSSSTISSNVNRNRQYTHLHAQLAQLNAQMADMENLLGMTAVQAEYMRGLGGWWGGAFMAASKILGEETASAAAGSVASKGEK